MKIYLAVIGIAFISGCISIDFKSDDNNKTLIKVSQATIDKVEAILAKAIIFVRKSENIALSKGRKLNPAETQYARALGIKHPENIRIKYQFRFPKPKDKQLLAEFNRLGFGSFFEGGRTNGYGIFIKSYFPNKKSIIHHELVHIKQMEDRGLDLFIKQYLEEAMTYDYFDIPLEVEAFKQTKGKKY